MTAHCGYAYFTLGCIDAAIKSTSCGEDINISLVAPDGFKYNWYHFDDNNQEIFDTILKHHKLLVELKGEKLAMLEMRSHVAWYIKGKPGSAKVKDTCNKQTDFNDVIAILKEYLDI